MSKFYKKIHEEKMKILYPIYILSEEPEEIDGLLLIADQVVDDKNMPGKTLGMRRLQTPMKSKYPLRYQLDDEVAMMKHRGKHFIDSNGIYWYDEKTTTTALKYHKIRKVEKKEIATVLWLKDVPFPFVEARPPQDGIASAGVLYKKGIPWKIWEYSEEKKKDTWRKI